MRILLFLMLLPCALTTQAQGNYSVRTIATTDPLLNGDSLRIYFHVPSAYQAGTPSKLIIGFHGLGNPDNSIQIREYLTPVGDSINAIVMCPDPYLQDQPRSEMVLNLAYDSVMTWYDIDPAEVYIIGYSAGSDVAAQYVFGDPLHPMKGFIWHSPGFFFSPDLSDPQTIPPVCLCSGTQDFTSILQTTLLDNELEGSGFPYLFNELAGVAHTMEYPAFTEEMLECLTFIDDNTQVLNIRETSQPQLAVAPNPVQVGEPLSLNGTDGLASIFLLDVQGRTLYDAVHTIADGKLVLEEVSRGLSSGIYVLSIQRQGQVSSFRLMVR